MKNKVFILCVALATICSGVQAEAGFFKKKDEKENGADRFNKTHR